MSKILSIFIFTFLLILQSCIEAPKNTRQTAINASTSTGTSNTASSPTFASDEILYWYSSSKIQGTIKINKNSQNTYYIRGKYIHNFLSSLDSSKVYNYNKYYCLVGNFSSSAYKQLRVRAIPIASTTSNKVTERMLRVELAVDTDNSAQCNFSVINSVANSSAAYALPNLCASASSCSGLATTSALSLYYANKSGTSFTSLSKVDATSIDTSAINLQVDLNSTSTTDTSVCSTSACSAKGFDCCVEGQCVNDATFKSGYSLSNLQSVNAQAYADYTANPLTFINYPAYFNICSNIVHQPSTTTDPAQTEAGALKNAQDRINAYLAKWYCMDDVANSSTNGMSNPYARCTGTSTSGNSTAYNEVRYYLAKQCGCTASSIDLMDTQCPNWTIKPVYKTSTTTNSIANSFLGYLDASTGGTGLTTGAARGNYYIISKGGTINSTSYLVGDWIIYDGSSWFKFLNNINDFICYTPAVQSQIGSITNLNVSVSARSAPHRFFATGGTNFDDISALPATITQEDKTGDTDFTYLDEASKSGPNSGVFNYKSVLGTMYVDLSKTAPAKMVTVELGKTYILSSISGYFTPCPQCARDSWFQSFFAHPSSQKGVGLQAIGYSTQRDAYGNNETFGNYEDTHFGRACYVPLTMIPIAHQKNSTLSTQRLNRLKTQTAFFVNGYQKDWYGFNKGALIGSFDGVTWFAVGTSRRITATSTKLFLAFNAAYLDLANKTDTVVNIIPDVSAKNTAPNLDFDPDLSMKDPMQGTAATCQKFHQCNTDSDCVAQLGWEYMCADVSQMKTTWPLFDSNANELKNQEKVTTLFDLLSTTISTTNSKRCVYRGAGAPCKRDISYFNSAGNATFKKILTCAPNFYCASISTNKFNVEVVRTPNEFDNILYGMDANVLGRPLNYVTANGSLTTDIISNIQYNGVEAYGLSTVASDMGMCQPGKLLATTISATPENDFVRSHSSNDALKRTDFISQIGSCNSNALGESRTLNCPVIGSDGNYLDPSKSPSLLAAEQNSCNAEVRHNTTYVSAFSSIESPTLAATRSISSPKFAADACMRRAGSICHTDLDCSPNTMHESLANGINLIFFGGTDAERSYWSESLICGQSTAQPLKNAANFYTYQLNQNRCCREIGKDFTMYTKGDKTFIPDQPTNSTSLDTRKFSYYDPSGLNRYSRYAASPLAHDVGSGNVYGASSKVPLVPLSTATASSIHEPNQEQWRVIHETGSLTCCGGGWIRKFADGTHTWPISNKLSFDTTNFSCLNFRSPLANSNFPTTNSSKMVTLSSSTASSSKYIVTPSYQNEYDQFCRRPQDGGCMQIPFKDSANFVVRTPQLYYPGKLVDETESSSITTGVLDSLNTVNLNYSRIDTSPTEDPTTSSSWSQRINVDVPYAPFAFYNPHGIGTYKGKAYNFFYNQTFGYSTHFYLPAYVGFGGKIDSSNVVWGADMGGSGNPLIANANSFIKKVYIKYYYPNSASGAPVNPKVEDITQNLVTDALCLSALSFNKAGLPADDLDPGNTQGSKWCLSYSSATGNRPVVVVRANTQSGGTYDGWSYAGVVIDFLPVEQYQGTKTTIPGNPLYYLEKLGRLELLGIPQITYEPLYCNDNHDNLVPGIFKSSLKTRANMSASGYSYSSFDPIESYNEDDSVNDSETSGYGNSENKFVYQNNIDHAAVFSSKDFTCCTPLGKEPKNGTASCCSGYATTSKNKSICALPSGTDLNVYFNKFVSSEGVGADQPGGGLVATYITDTDGDGTDDISSAQANVNIDFNPFTGEPKLRDSTFQKLYTLGNTYCANKAVIVGASFGSFPPEPFGGSYVSASSSSSYAYPTSIVDSIIDSSTDGSAGKILFDQGYRWNHHYYCK